MRPNTSGIAMPQQIQVAGPDKQRILHQPPNIAEQTKSVQPPPPYPGPPPPYPGNQQQNDPDQVSYNDSINSR